MKIRYIVYLFLFIGTFTTVGSYGSDWFFDCGSVAYGSTDENQDDNGDVAVEELEKLEKERSERIRNQKNEVAAAHLVSAYLYIVTRDASGLLEHIQGNPDSFDWNSKSIQLARKTAALLEKQIPLLLETGRVTQVVVDCFPHDGVNDAYALAVSIQEYVNDLNWLAEKGPLIAVGVRGSKVAYKPSNPSAEQHHLLMLETAKQSGLLEQIIRQLYVAYYKIYLKDLCLLYSK